MRAAPSVASPPASNRTPPVTLKRLLDPLARVSAGSTTTQVRRAYTGYPAMSTLSMSTLSSGATPTSTTTIGEVWLFPLPPETFEDAEASTSPEFYRSTCFTWCGRSDGSFEIVNGHLARTDKLAFREVGRLEHGDVRDPCCAKSSL